MSSSTTDAAPVRATTPFWLSGPFAPVADEVTAHDLPVTGEIPRALVGTYLRNGPNPKHGSSPHWWFGDGMVHGIRIAGGKARWYRNRYVRTARWEGSLTGTSPPGGDASAARHRRLRDGGTSNTHVIEHAGRILSLVEAAFPMQLDGELGTIGSFDFAGALDTPMTAHPKRCPTTGELHFFGYQLSRPHLVHYVADSDGAVVHRAELDVDGPSLMHDFAITERHVVFFDSPARMVSDWGAGMPFAWQDGRAARIGVVARGGGVIRWFDVEPGHLGHTANAFERDDTLVLEGIYSARFEASPPRLHRWEVDLRTGRTREHDVDDRFVEFPRIDDRRTGREHRYTYVVELRDVVAGVPTGSLLRRYDSRTGRSIVHDLGAGMAPGEAVFVPKPGEAAEEAGWLLTLVANAAGTPGELVIIDAAHFDAEPVARVRLPQRVPFGFHGSWISRGQRDCGAP